MPVQRGHEGSPCERELEKYLALERSGSLGERVSVRWFHAPRRICGPPIPQQRPLASIAPWELLSTPSGRGSWWASGPDVPADPLPGWGTSSPRGHPRQRVVPVLEDPGRTAAGLRRGTCRTARSAGTGSAGRPRGPRGQAARCSSGAAGAISLTRRESRFLSVLFLRSHVVQSSGEEQPPRLGSVASPVGLLLSPCNTSRKFSFFYI